MSRDVIVVTITQQLARGVDVRVATHGDWLVSPSTAEKLAYVVGVSKGTVHAIYAIDGFDVIRRPGRRDRIRFSVSDTTLDWVGEAPRMYGAFVLRDSEQVLTATSPDSDVPERAQQSTRPPASRSRYTAIPLTADTVETPGPLRVVQFPHPGFEHSVPKGQSSGEFGWRTDGSTHNRKYLTASGSFMTSAHGDIEHGGLLGFWGEWEAPSTWQRIAERGGAYHPSVVHRPVLPARRPDQTLQNTDPLVFGDAFLYTNCKMNRHPMKRMPSGSLVLFGRGMKVDGRDRFVLDTCFVVDHRLDYLDAPAGELPRPGQDLLTDTVLAPLHSGQKPGKRTRIHPYLGRSPEGADGGPFSFFPAVLHEERPLGFARPVLEPEGALKPVLKETLKMGMRTTWGVSPESVRAVWDEVVRQVVDRDKLLLGVHAAAPAWGSA